LRRAGPIAIAAHARATPALRLAPPLPPLPPPPTPSHPLAPPKYPSRKNPRCGHCKSLQPAWEQAARALQGVVGVAAVDADAHGSLAQQYSVQGFPTIKLFYTNDAGRVVSGSSDYQGARDAKSIATWALDKARSYAMKKLGGGGGGGGGGGQQRPSGGGGGGGGGGGFYGGTDVVTLTESNFDAEVARSDDLWLVEFYAPW
jgi:protein disulfide-isomerase A6